VNQALLALFGTIVSLTLAAPTWADWKAFRGNNGDGVADNAYPPVKWSDKENVRWKTELPGPGSSSPIILGDRVYITCYSGYGVSRNNPGSPQDLKRHLVCVNRKTGKILWDKTVPSTVTEDPYRGFITEHGYASSTPVTDGKNIYVYFGKSGVLAFDLDGKQLWQQSVGTSSDFMKWGSGSSPILFEDLVIINAAYESKSVQALNKKTGKPAWKAEASGLSSSYSSPAVVSLPDGKSEVIISVDQEVWALNPETGKLRWYAETGASGSMSPTPIAQDGIVYVTGGKTGKTLAVRAGGKGDATKQVMWNNRSSSSTASPVLYKDKLFVLGARSVYCLDGKSGKLLKETRLNVASSGFSGGFYASLTVGGDKLYAVSRTAGVFVLSADADLKLLATNRFEGDSSQSNATPAMSGNDLILRTDRYLYCVAEE
jgi:outer membrane protein assembly factor BamB